SGNLLEDHIAGIGLQGEDVLLVFNRGTFEHSGEEFSWTIFHGRDGPGCGSTVDVHVPDSEKDGDTLAGAAGVVFLLEDDDAAVSGGNNGARSGGDEAFGIAEKGEDKGGEQAEDRAGDPPR